MDLGNVTIGDITNDDIIIALMGPTGAGKNTFIDVATKQDGKTIGHGLQSYTTKIRSVRFPHPQNGCPVVFVDTPGFDDTNKSDTEILKMIADWLEKTYKNEVMLAGIVYLHRISDNRMAGSPIKNLRMFANLCGDEAVRNVSLATTMWSEVTEDIGSHREEELHGKYWKSMLDNGSSMDRFQMTFDSAWSIVQRFVQHAQAKALLIQEEIVDLHRRLNETHAGRTLSDALHEMLANQKEALRKLREEVEGQNNAQLIKKLNARREKIQDDLRRTFDEVEKMKIPLRRRIRLFFSFKKTHAHALKTDTASTEDSGRQPVHFSDSNHSGTQTSIPTSPSSSSVSASSPPRQARTPDAQNFLNKEAVQQKEMVHIQTYSVLELAPDVTDLTGQIVNVQEYADFGGLADIHRGRWTNDQGECTVAVKVLRFRGLGEDGNARLIKRLKREVRAWHNLDHPNIVRLLGVSYHMNDRPAMIMPWYEKGNAATYLKGREDPSEKMMLIQDIASGLTYLHTRNRPVVHGDLKGNNVLITDDGHAALSDFGLSQIIEETVGPTGLTTTTVAGSTRWQAPEILRGDVDDRGRQRLTTASDVWSFACTVYELLTGKVPYYQCKTPYMVGQSILGGVKLGWEENGSALRDLSSEFATLLDSCWSFEAPGRPSILSLLSYLSEPF